MAIKVRFAPSPTGYLHVGGARTALVNWLLARKSKGTFILRIEDTDEARSTPEMTQGILEGMKWLGIEWNEGPFYQSRRQDLYCANALKLIRSGLAYRCFCSKEELEKRRQASGKPDEWKYDRRCRALPEADSNWRASQGVPFVVRCAIPDSPLEWEDIVKGPISFRPGEVDDFVLLRSDGTPTYHLSVVSDDADMGITHVIRGEDHISNTPKQVALYEGLGLPAPTFGHLPLILGMDKKKLSKRHGVTSVLAYRDEGILPLALFNFLAQLGANLGDEPFLPVDSIVERFELSSLKKSASVFDRAQLAFINAKVIGETPVEELVALVRPFLKALMPDADAVPEAAVAVMKTRAKDLRELAEGLVPFLTKDFSYDPKGLEKAKRDGAALAALAALCPVIEGLTGPEWRQEAIEAALRKHAEESGVKAGALIHPCRLFLTGRTESPGIFDVIWAMGKEGALERIRKGLAELRANP